jgi:hypothetical protein
MNVSAADPVDPCERLRRAKRELEAIRQEYGAYDDHDLDVDDLGDPIEPDAALSSVCGSLLLACNALDGAVRTAARLREG